MIDSLIAFSGTIIAWAVLLGACALVISIPIVVLRAKSRANDIRKANAKEAIEMVKATMAHRKLTRK